MAVAWVHANISLNKETREGFTHWRSTRKEKLEMKIKDARGKVFRSKNSIDLYIFIFYLRPGYRGLRLMFLHRE